MQLSARLLLQEGSFIQIFVGEDGSGSNDSQIQDADSCLGHSTENMAEQPLFEQYHSASTRFGVSDHASRAYTARCWFGWMSLLCTLFAKRATLTFVLVAYLLLIGVERVGEAQHPGPAIWIGTTNPSGLRGKEETYFTLPQGLWGVAETHLTSLNQRDATGVIHRLGRSYNRGLQIHHGHPVAPRSARSTTGTWAGVSMISDLPCRPLHIPWPHSEPSLGRVQLLQSWCGPFQMTGANLYGWPQSPTWPRAKEATESMLNHLTKELVLSRTGPRFIMGDFNSNVEDSPSVTVWKAQGWVDVQTWAFQHYGRVPTLTSKHATILDHVFLSPELACYLSEVQSWQLFADHACIGACLNLPVAQVTQQVWPMPAYIPYERVDKEGWQQAAMSYQPPCLDSIDDQFSGFCQDYERSFHGHIDLPGRQLTPAMMGRGQPHRVESRPQQCPILRPSRPGEVTPSSDLLGRTVHKWFLQLRRLQSLLHALRAGKTTWDAKIYRVELWRAICQAKGFEGSFAFWWSRRPIQCHGSPRVWPQRVPTVSEMNCIFLDFETNYRHFEAWHARQRQELLHLALQENHSKLFAMVKPAAKSPLQHLEAREDAIVLGTSDDRCQLHVDRTLDINSSCEVEVDGEQVTVTHVEDAVLTFQTPLPEGTHEVVSVTRHFSTAAQIHEHLASFWQQRWWKAPPSEADWNRIFDFCKVYIPEQPERHMDITAANWHDINLRYGQKAARGPDGFARRDLQWMPQMYQDSLVHQLNRWEETSMFPTALCTGFAHPLPKRQDSCKVNDYRPVIIYSMIYRSWSSLRARQLLRHIKKVAGQHQFGFLPQKENVEIWMVLQAWIEDASLAKEPLAGFVSDIEKAFECLPRRPVFWLAKRLGISSKILGLWDYFLTNMERRFNVSNQVGPALYSNSGFPEGCGLSCVAMALVNLVYHLYMTAYSKVTALSFVDNLELLGRGSIDLHTGILTMQAWAEMWHLQLDKGKSYVWANQAELRNQCQNLGWEAKTHAKDLGAPMTYGSKHSVVDQVERIASLRALWPLLRRLSCSSWHKQRLLHQAFWPRAYYGSAICCMGWLHTKQLRTEAMKALRFNRGGANPGMRLAVLSEPTTDPGYFQFWQVLLTFQRVANKQPGFVELWRSFMHKYQGAPSYGPFGKLLEVCGQVGWSVQPPFLYDHDGVKFNLITVERKHLEDVATDAWRQGVAHAFTQRKDVEGLEGVDWRALHAVFRKLPHHQKETLHVLQDGTFMDSQTHRRYDLSKTGKCRHCGDNDTMLHRCTACPARRQLYAQHADLQQQWPVLSPALCLRLLPSRNQYEAQFKQMMETSAARSLTLKRLADRSHLDLFTDGSCWNPELPWASVGAWAVVSASHDVVAAKGVLAGPHQTSDQAELQAILVAVEFAVCNKGTTTLWTDSAFAAEGVHRLLQNLEDCPGGRYTDYWMRIQRVLYGHTHRIAVQHVPAHVATGGAYVDVDDWAAGWNDRADHEASAAHQLRDHDLESLRLRMLQVYHDHCALLQRLAHFHLDLAASHFVENNENVVEEEDTVIDIDAGGLDGHRLALHHDPWQRGLPDASPLDWRVVQMADKFGWLFTQNMFAWLKGQTLDEAVVAYQMSYLELAVYHGSGQVNTKLPVPDPKRRLCWVDPSTLPAAAVSRPTVAAILALFQNFFVALDNVFDFGLQFVHHLDLTRLGAMTPQRGVTLLISRATVNMTERQLTEFTQTRPIRRSGDLTRPIR